MLQECHIELRRTRTGLLLEAGGTYDFDAEGEWHDASIRTDADGHSEPKLRYLRFLRRSRPNLWFALMGNVGRRRFLIGSHARIRFEQTGELICFANDAPFTYRNNSGQIRLRVTRVS